MPNGEANSRAKMFKLREKISLEMKTSVQTVKLAFSPQKYPQTRLSLIVVGEVV